MGSNIWAMGSEISRAHKSCKTTLWAKGFVTASSKKPLV